METTTGEQTTSSDLLGFPNTEVEMNATLATLPDELLIEILSYTSQNDAVSLIQTSKRFKRPCEIRLYRRIILSNSPSDEFLKHVASLQGKTLSTTTSASSRFLEHMHTKIRTHKNEPYHSYIEEIVSFDLIGPKSNDQGSSNVDGHVLERCLSLVALVGSCKGLRSLILPRATIYIWKFLPVDTLDRLHSISLELAGPNTEIPTFSCIPSLKNVEKMIVNCTVEHDGADKELTDIFSKAPSLKEFEFGCKFGEYDTTVRQRLLSHSTYRILTPQKLLDYAYNSKGSRQGLTNHCESVKDFGPNDNLHKSSLLIETETQPISTVPLSKITLFNWRFSRDMNEGWMLKMLELSMESNTLRELHIVNCTVRTIAVERGRDPIIEGLAALLRSTKFQEYKHLKKLTVGQVEECLTDKAFRGNRKDQVHQGLCEFALKTESKLTHICIHASEEWNPSCSLSILPMKDSLLHVTYFSERNMNDVMRRVVTTKAMKEVSKAGNLESLDSQLDKEEKMMAQFVYCTHTTDNYGHRDACNPMPTSAIVEHFRDEFTYLYKSQVKALFQEMPKLRTFTLYGFPFKREDVM